jgi:hypothetical protein
MLRNVFRVISFPENGAGKRMGRSLWEKMLGAWSDSPYR